MAAIGSFPHLSPDVFPCSKFDGQLKISSGQHFNWQFPLFGHDQWRYPFFHQSQAELYHFHKLGLTEDATHVAPLPNVFMSLKNTCAKFSGSTLFFTITVDLFFSQCASGRYPSNPAFWLVPVAGRIFLSLTTVLVTARKLLNGNWKTTYLGWTRDFFFHLWLKDAIFFSTLNSYVCCKWKV